MSKVQKLKTDPDKDGNYFVVTQQNGIRTIGLKLASDSRQRRIGEINLKREILEVRRERERHLLQKNNSYGFNYHVIKTGKLFKQIRLIDEIEEWLIPKEFILENGQFLYFKNNGGFELQIFVTLDSIKQFRKKSLF